MVADSGFLPSRVGGQKEHLGFVRTAFAAGHLAALVVPTAEPLPRAEYAALVPGLPVIAVPRKTSRFRLLHPRHPFVVASRPYKRGLADEVRAVAPDATGVLTFTYKSHGLGSRLAAELGLPMVVRQHNREGDYHRSLAGGLRGPRRWVMQWEAWRIGRDELRLDRSPAVRAMADISADDAAQRRSAGAGRVLHIPPFAFDVTAPPSTGDRIRPHPGCFSSARLTR